MKDPKFFGWGSGSPCASPRKQKPTAGLQLLSPSVQQQQMAESRRTVVVEAQPSSTSSTASLTRSTSSLSTKKQVAFDFDAFTLESVRQRQEQQQQPVDEPEATPAPVRSSSSHSSSTQQQQATNNDVDVLRDQFEHNGFFDTNSFYTMRSTDDFEHLRKQHSSSMSATSSVHNLNMSTMTERENSASRPTTSHQPVAASAVVHSGWLQKRKGLVIKRWKSQYCVLKADAKLCLYASEDVVNGKLEHRFQLLRVSLSSKSDAFQIIGVGRDGGPCKEEFRAAHSVDWQAWFCALRDYFESKALHSVLQRKPELSLLSPANRSLQHDDSGITHEVKQMILGSRRVVRNGSIPHPYPGSPRSDRQSVSSRKLSTRRESTDSPAFDDSNSSRSTLSSNSGASSNRVSIFQAPEKANEEESLADPVPADEWPMIQRDSQYPVPILEGRGSESQSTVPSDACDNTVVKAAVFSW